MKKNKTIPGGYYIKARRIQESKVAHACPCVRELWDWFLKEANHSPRTSSGTLIQRGQCVRTYSDIREALKWFAGNGSRRYTKWQIEHAVKWLRGEKMITIDKTTRGMVVTILNYDFYQTASNYEYAYEPGDQNHNPPQLSHTINKNEKNDKKKEEKTNILDISPKLLKKTKKDIISYLNNKAGTNFKATADSTDKFLSARLKEAPVNVILAVIDIKCKEWLKNKRMKKYLRPETLFNATKFESYRNEIRSLQKTGGKYDGVGEVERVDD